MSVASPLFPSLVRLGDERFVLEDSASGRRWELGQRDWLVLVLMRAGTSDVDIQEQVRRRFGEEVSPQQLCAFRAALDPVAKAGSNAPTASGRANQGPLLDLASERRLNAFFDALAKRFGWMISDTFLYFVCGFAILAAYVLFLRYERAFYDLEWIIRTSPVPLVLTLLVLKLALRDLPREIAAGIACRLHRGRVRSFGIRLHRNILPYVYCDTGYSTALMQPGGIWAMLLVRVGCDLLIASLAVSAWTMMPSGSLPANLALLAGLATMIGLAAFAIGSRSEAEFIISQLFGIPDFRRRAESAARAMLSFRPDPEPRTAVRRFWFRTLGVISLIQSAVVYGLVVGFGTWWLVDEYGGIGALLAAALLVVWHYKSILDVVRNSMWSWLAKSSAFLHGWRLGLVLVVVATLACLIPYNYEVVGDCVIVPEHQRGARAQLAAEIVSIEVEEGGWIEQGEPLVIFNDREIGRDLAVTKAKLTQAEAELKLLETGARAEDVAMAELRVAHWEHRKEYTQNEFERFRRLKESNATSDIELQRAKSEWENAQNMYDRAQESLDKVREGTREERLVAQRAEVEQLQAELKYYEQMSEQLKLRAPISGRMVTPSLHERVGQVSQKGDLIAVVQDDRRLQAVLAAHQSAAHQAQPGMEVNIRLYGNNGALIRGKVRQVGGAVFSQRDFTTSTVSSEDELRLEKLSQAYDTGDSYARILIDIEPKDAERLKPGMSGYGRVVIANEVLGYSLFRHVKRFVCTDVWSWLP
jgi:multidrug resistance efflux pump